MFDEDPCQAQEELASVLGVTRRAISKRLHALGIIQKQGTSVPYDLKSRYVERRFFACEQLLPLADPVESTVREYSDRSLTVL